MSFITDDINRAIQELESSRVVAMPTETVYGLAANIENDAALELIFRIKNRPINHPLIVHIADINQLDELISFTPNYIQRLIENFWPGPLTLILKKSPKVSKLITGSQETVAVRMPSHPVALNLIRTFDRPLAAPSANRFGQLSPTTAQHVKDAFPNEDLLILDGERCTVGIESTIIDATDPKGYQILRHGLITAEQLEKISPGILHNSSNTLRAPGLLKQHYQPKKPLHLFKTPEELFKLVNHYQGDVYIIHFSQLEKIIDCEFFQMPNTAEKAAFELYYQLKIADTSKAQAILIEMPSGHSDWAGINDRLIKARTIF